MKVTISIINYNYGRYLRQAITSALNQKEVTEPFEVLVVDDGSTDDSDEIIQSFLDHPNFRFSKTKNQGFGATLTRAIQEAQGEYVFLMDADDYFLENKVSAFLPHIKAGKLFVHDGLLPFYHTENIPGDVMQKGGCTSTIAVRRSEALDMLPVENEISFHVLEHMGYGIVLDKPHTVYRYHNNSMTNRKEPGKQNKYLAGVTHRLADKLELLIKGAKVDWLKPKSKSLRVRNYYRCTAYYNELEMCLETRQYIDAYKKYMHMFYYYISGTGNRIHFPHVFKMLIRTILMKPTFKKVSQ